MKNEKKKLQDFECLKEFLDLKRLNLNLGELDSFDRVKNYRIYVFFNLIYLKLPLDFILESNPIDMFKKLQEGNKHMDVYQICAILLSCNLQNIETFTKIPTFINICARFCEKFRDISNLPAFIQCIQISVLYHIDSRFIKPILRHIKVLRESGIITFHDEKCIRASLQADSKRAKDINQNESQKGDVEKDTSFVGLDISGTKLKMQIDSILRTKKILQNIPCTQNLGVLCENIENIGCGLVKNVCLVGKKKVGKSTLMATILHGANFRAKESSKDSNDKESALKLEAIAPIYYTYGHKDEVVSTYLKPDVINSLKSSPLKNLSNSIKELSEKFQDSINAGKHSVELSEVQDSLYASKKISIVENLNVCLKPEILKYVNFTNTPSLIPITFRHLQTYNCVTRSNIILYLINANTLLQNTQTQINEEAVILARIINKKHIEHIYIIYTQMDKVGLTLKRRQNIYVRFKTALQGHLSTMNLSAEERESLLKKLNFQYVSSIVAGDIRNNASKMMSRGDIGLDIATSGIPGLERVLFNDVFEVPLNHVNIRILRAVLKLLSKDPKKSGGFVESKNITAELNSLAKNLDSALKKLNKKYASFSGSFSNLRENLYAQFIQSLNYEIRSKANFKRLKTSIIQSIIVGLHSLSEILQDSFLNLYEIQEIDRILDIKNSLSFLRLASSPEHKEILEIIYTEFVEITGHKLFDESNIIVTEHLSNMLDSILPNNIKKDDIKKDSIIKPIKESFDYYFSILEKNISVLFSSRVEMFSGYIKIVLEVLESMFVKYYEDSMISLDYNIQEINELLDTV